MGTKRFELGEERERWMDAIRSTLQDLSTLERGVFVLQHYRSHDVEQISRELSLSVQEVRRLLSSANLKLTRNLKSYRRRVMVSSTV